LPVVFYIILFILSIVSIINTIYTYIFSLCQEQNQR
jgi:hypothetical protein